MPIGPGVDSETAIMLVSSLIVYQPVFWPISVRKGMVASPPPIAKSPVLKNSKTVSGRSCLHLPYSLQDTGSDADKHYHIDRYIRKLGYRKRDDSQYD